MIKQFIIGIDVILNYFTNVEIDSDVIIIVIRT